MLLVELYDMVKNLAHLVQPLLSYSTPFRSRPPLATMLTSFRENNAKLLVFFLRAVACAPLFFSCLMCQRAIGTVPMRGARKTMARWHIRREKNNGAQATARKNNTNSLGKYQ